MAFGNQADIVAAELLSVKDKVSLVDAIAFPLAGDHIAGLAGALVGASLVPSKLIYTYRVLRSDNSYDKIKLNGNDPRNDILLNLPYIPDYLDWKESEKLMEEEYQGNTAAAQPPVANSQSTHTEAANGSVVIGPGNYVFGENFPTGSFDLKVLAGSGSLWIYDDKGGSSLNYLGDEGEAMSWNGLTYNGNKSFTLSGSLQVQVTRAQMIQI